MKQTTGSFDRLVRPDAMVGEAAARNEARFIATLHLVLLPMSSVAILVQAWFNPAFAGHALMMTPGLGVMTLAYTLARSRWYRVATWLTLVLGTGMSVVPILGDPSNPVPFAYLLVPAILASALLPDRQAVLVALANLALAIGLAVVNAPVVGSASALTIVVMVTVMTTMIGLVARHRSQVEAERRRELEQRDRRQSTLLEVSFGGMALLGEGRVIECSRGFAAMFGYTPGELLGVKIDRFLAPQAGALTGEREAVHRDGHIFPVEVVALPYEELGGTRLAVAIRNLTEHRRMQAQLHQADRMATMGQLAAGVAHEINNPLSWVIGNLDLLAEQLDGDSLDIASRAVEGAHRVERIVRDLKTFSRTRPPEPKAVDLEVTVSSAVNMVRHQLRDKGVLIEDYGPCPTIDGDETRVGQVCLNLLVNAIEALPPDARDQNRIEVRLYTDANGEAVIEVADTGPGIPIEIRHRMFEPFFTTKAQGTGLGLSITRSITASLGGRLEVRSAPGTGTTMRVVLPPGLLRAATPATPTRAQPLRRATGRVLFIDDEPDICELVIAALGDDVVSTAGSVTDALRYLEETRFEAILCDLMMPERTGMDLYHEAVRRWPDLSTRFAFVTGGAYTEEARAFLDQVRAPVLAKPFKLAELRALVDRMLQEPLVATNREP